VIAQTNTPWSVSQRSNGRHACLQVIEENGEGPLEGDSMDAPTLMAGQAREVAAAFEKTRWAEGCRLQPRMSMCCPSN